jgi:ubiquinol-cytochrome c reductase cytochrome c1 subunit
MIKLSTIFAAALMGLGLAASPAQAQEGHETIVNERQAWSFAGPFGTYDEHQLQRGFQVFREVCSNCHETRLLAFRNLGEEGGPGFSEAQVKALAAEYTIADLDAEGGERKAIPSDRWPGTELSATDLKDGYGVVPTDLSVIAKARGIKDTFPTWALNYVTGYQEGGPDYVHALLTGYEDPAPAGAEIPEGKFYNKVFPGHAIGMPPPLSDGQVAYSEAEDGVAVPLTVEQYSRDVSAFLMWVADPHMVSRKEAGFRVLLFLILFAGIMYLVKNRLWRDKH